MIQKTKKEIFTIPVLDSNTRYYTPLFVGYFRINTICKNCLIKFCVDFEKGTIVDDVLDDVFCPNCDITGMVEKDINAD